MKYLKEFKIFENRQSDEEIHKLCKEYNIRNYTVNLDGSIDVDGDVDLYYYTGLQTKGRPSIHSCLNKIPLKFNRVEGFFDCRFNKLTSLKGSPNYVVGNFYCGNNLLRTLKDGPKEVMGDYDCQYSGTTSGIVSLEGFPDYLGGHFNCRGNMVHELWDLFRTKDDVELFNWYDIVIDEYTERPKVVLQRLNAFLDQVGKDRLENLKKYYHI